MRTWAGVAAFSASAESTAATESSEVHSSIHLSESVTNVSAEARNEYSRPEARRRIVVRYSLEDLLVPAYAVVGLKDLSIESCQPSVVLVDRREEAGPTQWFSLSK